MKNNTKYRQSIFAMIGIALGLAVVPASKAIAASPNPDVFPTDEVVLGMTYGEWSAAWWKYVFAIPAANNPTNDITGQFCDIKQSGPVRLLAGLNSGEAVERNCTVPSGKAIFFPIINVECSTVEPEPFSCSNEAECRACAGAFADAIGISTLKASIDGINVHALSGYRVQSPFFNFTLSGNNILGLPAGTGSSVSDGYWLMLKPLPPGNHVIHFEGAFVSGLGNGFSQNVTYHLTVTE